MNTYKTQSTLSQSLDGTHTSKTVNPTDTSYTRQHMQSKVKHIQQVRRVHLIKFNPNRQNTYTRTSVFRQVVLLNVLGCRLTYQGQAETSAEAWFNIVLRPRKPEGSLGRTAPDGHLDSHTAPELCRHSLAFMLLNVHGGGMTYQGRGQSGKGTG